jgi:hypothetical protein
MKCFNCNSSNHVCTRELNYICRPKKKYNIPEYNAKFSIDLCNRCYIYNYDSYLIGRDSWDAMDGLKIPENKYLCKL